MEIGRVKYNTDGSLKSFCVKAVVPVEEALGVTGEQGREDTDVAIRGEAKMSKDAAQY